MTPARESVDPQLLRQLEAAAGDYLADVAELLLNAGYPVGPATSATTCPKASCTSRTTSPAGSTSTGSPSTAWACGGPT